MLGYDDLLLFMYLGVLLVVVAGLTAVTTPALVRSLQVTVQVSHAVGGVFLDADILPPGPLAHLMTLSDHQGRRSLLLDRLHILSLLYLTLSCLPS